MSNIKTIDTKKIQGRIDVLSISSSNQSTNNFDATCTIVSDEIWTDCIFCKNNAYAKHRFMDEGICELCRDKMINRIKLILDFQ